MEGEVEPTNFPSGGVQTPLLLAGDQRDYGTVDATPTTILQNAPPSSFPPSVSIAAICPETVVCPNTAVHPNTSVYPDTAIHLPSYLDATGAGTTGGGSGEEQTSSSPTQQRQATASTAVFVDLEKLVCATMCIPDPMVTPPHYERNIILLSCVIYFALSVIGAVIIAMTSQSNNWLRSESELLHVKIAAILAGAFFVLVEIYWVVLYWWSRPSRRRSVRDFSFLGSCWWILSFYFIAVTVFLLSEVLRKFDAIFGSAVKSTEDGKVDIVVIKMAFILMMSYLYYCIFVFFVMKMEKIVFNRWKSERET